ncbi:hypothetical protein [Novosphingobium sp. KA1]|uniref:hypothetical protein n=1 Tax=Novosphingobium sp. (strain KA1) TaxID=164608 RepID=UPI001A8ED0A3|nr:hypothetical protein [Novosphingobium sp. KA1]QSR19131.1 hypothetical protein CA833_18220 [Novosphingobium sp. KA1]
MLRIEIAATDGAGSVKDSVKGGVNEDCVGHHGNAAWVIDGATGVGPRLLDAPSDASWLAQKANGLLAEGLAQSPDIPTTELLRQVMRQCGEALQREQTGPRAEAHEHPSAAFAMVRVIGGEAEITTLADCRVIANQGQVFGSSALDAIEARTIAALRQILAEEGEISPEAFKARLLPGLLANRRLMNRAGGYWVLGTEPRAADHVWQVRFPVRPGARFALASDGFLRLFELFDAAEPADLLAISGQRDWAHWLARLRELESAPESLRQFARVKRHDDASLVICSWENDG